MARGSHFRGPHNLDVVINIKLLYREGNAEHESTNVFNSRTGQKKTFSLSKSSFFEEEYTIRSPSKGATA